MGRQLFRHRDHLLHEIWQIMEYTSVNADRHVRPSDASQQRREPWEWAQLLYEIVLFIYLFWKFTAIVYNKR